MNFLKSSWKWLVAFLGVVILIVVIQAVTQNMNTIYSFGRVDIAEVNGEDYAEDEESVDEDGMLTDSNEETESQSELKNTGGVTPPDAYEAREISHQMMRDLVQLGLEYDTLGEVPDVKDSLEERDYQLIRETMLHYATDDFYPLTIDVIESIYANYDETGRFTSSFWPEVRYAVVEETQDRITYEYIVFPIYSYQSDTYFNYLGGIVTLTLVWDGTAWKLDNFVFDYNRTLDITPDEVVVFYRDVLEQGTPVIVGESEDEYGSYIAFDLDGKRWRMYVENGEVFEAE